MLEIIYLGAFSPELNNFFSKFCTQGLWPLTLQKYLNTVFEICNYIQCSSWGLQPLTFLNPVHLYSFMIPRLLSCGNYTNIHVIFCCCQLYIYQIQYFYISIKSLSQIAFFIAFCLEITLQTHMLFFFSFSFFSVVLGPLPLQSVLYLLRVLRVYIFRCGFSGPSASCILLNFMIPNQIQCCARDLWPLAFYKFLLNHCPRLLLCGNYTNIHVFFFLLLAIIYILDTVLRNFGPLQFLISIKSLSQTAFIAFCLETTLQTHMFIFFIFIFQCGALSLALAIYIIFAQSLLFQMWCFRTFSFLHSIIFFLSKI